MDIKPEMQKLKRAIDREITVYMDRVIEETQGTDVFVASVARYFKKTILAGGKRIRPIMMYWGYRAAGGTDEKEIIKTSISIELIHAFLLMHDDIIDRDDLRHGKKTIHAQYRDHYKRFFNGQDAEHFGESMGIIAGDFVYSLGNQVLFSSRFDSALIIRALNKLQEIVGLTCIGEVQDIYMEHSRKITKKNILRMYENKTARYTFDGPLKLGAILAGADEKFCDGIEKFSVPAGIAFQIKDDILGVFGNSRKTGKPVGSDIAEGKRTFLVETALECGNDHQKKRIMKILGNQKIGVQDIVEFQDLLRSCGALDKVEIFMKDLIMQSDQELTNMQISPDARTFLKGLIMHLNNREK